MSNQIQPFDFNGIQVRVLTDEHGNPWFLGADVCAILGTATNHIREYLDADEITNIRSTDIAQNGGKAPFRGPSPACTPRVTQPQARGSRVQTLGDA